LREGQAKMIELRTLQGRTLQTATGKPFQVTAVGRDYVRVAPRASDRPRPVRRAIIDAAVAIGAAVRPSDLQPAFPTDRNLSYAAAIARTLLEAAGREGSR
jgi:hypothetical protein